MGEPNKSSLSGCNARHPSTTSLPKGWIADRHSGWSGSAGVGCFTTLGVCRLRRLWFRLGPDASVHPSGLVGRARMPARRSAVKPVASIRWPQAVKRFAAADTVSHSTSHGRYLTAPVPSTGHRGRMLSQPVRPGLSSAQVYVLIGSFQEMSKESIMMPTNLKMRNGINIFATDIFASFAIK